MSIDEYFESVKDYILADSSVADLKVIKQVNRSNNGHLRARIRFLDDSVLEFSEFIEKSSGNEIQLVTYSYHWANAQNTLLRRWDNTPHFPQWENTPHHIHVGEQVFPGSPVNIFSVLDEIATYFRE